MKDCNIAVISDIHLGHRSNDTTRIIDDLSREIFSKKLLSKINMLFLAGDVFDRLLQLDYPALPEIDTWIARLLIECQKAGVLLRVLEGTPSHDRGQNERFETIYGLIDSKTDFKYVKELSIENIPAFNCNVLYVPDEWRADNAQTFAEIQELLKKNSLKQVDLVIMHGQFEYQLPIKLDRAVVHDEQAFTKIAKVAIFVGHIHTHSRSGKIIAQGSFDRLRHGEEEPKGYVWASIKSDRISVEFIENKNARIYKTVKVYGLDIQSTLDKIEKELKKLTDYACLRIEGEPGHAIFANFFELQRRFPNVTFTKLPKDKKTGEAIALPDNNEFAKWQPIDINKDNIVSLLINRLPKKLESSDVEYIKQQIKEAL